MFDRDKKEYRILAGGILGQRLCQPLSSGRPSRARRILIIECLFDNQLT